MLLFSNEKNRNQLPLSNYNPVETLSNIIKEMFRRKYLLYTLSWCSYTGVVACFPKAKSLAWELALGFWDLPPVQHHGWVSGLRVPGLVAPCGGPRGHLAFSLWALRHVAAGPQDAGYCCATDVHPVAPCIVQVEHPGTTTRIRTQ